MGGDEKDEAITKDTHFDWMYPKTNNSNEDIHYGNNIFLVD